MRATTSCEVMPVGLLILKIPSIYLSFQLCYNHRYCLYKRHMQRRTGCPLMTATSEMHADGSSIIRSRTAQAQPCQIRLSIAFEEGSNLHSFNVTQHTREVIIHLRCGPCCRQGLVSRVGPDQAALARSPGVGNHRRLETHQD